MLTDSVMVRATRPGRGRARALEREVHTQPFSRVRARHYQFNLGPYQILAWYLTLSTLGVQW